MFDTHVDTVWVWVAVGTVSVAVFGIVSQIPTTAAPDGESVAMTIDEVATSPPGSVATHDLDATEWAVTRRQIGLRSEGGTVHETLLHPVVPATNESLVAVLNGEAPSTAFNSTEAFNAATEQAATNTTRFRAAPEKMRVKRVSWGDVDVTLVG